MQFQKRPGAMARAIAQDSTRQSRSQALDWVRSNTVSVAHCNVPRTRLKMFMKKAGGVNARAPTRQTPLACAIPARATLGRRFAASDDQFALNMGVATRQGVARAALGRRAAS